MDLSLVQRGPEPTTLAVPSLAPDGSAAYGFYVEGTADRLFTLPEALPAGTRALALGTCSLALEPGASAYEALLRRESGRGVLTLLDPNIRPALIADPVAYRARFLGWLPYVSVLKLSEEDARWLGGRVSDWLAAGPSAVVLTRGAQGLTVRTREGAEYTAAARRVAVADTIGAGDTVNAALLHRLSGPANPAERPGGLARRAGLRGPRGGADVHPGGRGAAVRGGAQRIAAHRVRATAGANSSTGRTTSGPEKCRKKARWKQAPSSSSAAASGSASGRSRPRSSSRRSRPVRASRTTWGPVPISWTPSRCRVSRAGSAKSEAAMGMASA